MLHLPLLVRLDDLHDEHKAENMSIKQKMCFEKSFPSSITSTFIAIMCFDQASLSKLSDKLYLATSI